MNKNKLAITLLVAFGVLAAPVFSQAKPSILSSTRTTSATAPGVVKPGGVSPQLVHQADLMRTFADALGTTIPDHVGEDSVSLLPLFKGGKKTSAKTQ